MKKVLILSYHFPPLNVIASQRALGYANYLKNHGLEPTVLTFDWNKSPMDQQCDKKSFYTKIIEEKNDRYTVIRIPVIKRRFLKFMGKQEGNLIYRIWILWCWLNGRLDVSPKVVEYGLSEYYYLRKFVKKGDYDIVIGIYSPHFHLKNAFRLYKKKEIPYVLDYRDLWDNVIIHQNYQPNLKQRMYDYFVSKYWKKWAKHAKVLTITSRPWADKLQEVVEKNVHVITNGFCHEEFNGRQIKKSRKFRILHTGSLYKHQDFTVFNEGLKIFIKELSPVDFEVKFLGAIRSTYQGGGLNGFLSRDEFDSLEKLGGFVKFTERIPREEVMEEMMMANLLYIPTFPKAPGTYGGKIFEYLGSGIPIVAIPSDHGVIKELLEGTNSGHIFEEPYEFALYLKEVYETWKTDSNEAERHPSLNAEVLLYSRESQTKRMSDLIKNELDINN
ncbi:glycosyltransferase [Parvicella tangerina]|uniref:Glycosyltransferase subfamily 4-like N-terminal domain-containing protein n=1 Tax=Parvicella tangerina TaxID=2829795 RepID=A0A916ND18_9FLAO|nr:glycosyltransferase [Parvicella tangerina]CAG5084311.1 hypothetical protein CRYO30217_02433 [Parvicella tangerina]